MNDDPLVSKMRQLAKMLRAVEAAELNRLADALDLSISRLSDPDLKGQKQALKVMLGCWARARRYYCSLTGEDLI